MYRIECILLRLFWIIHLKKLTICAESLRVVFNFTKNLFKFTICFYCIILFYTWLFLINFQTTTLNSNVFLQFRKSMSAASFILLGTVFSLLECKSDLVKQVTYLTRLLRSHEDNLLMIRFVLFITRKLLLLFKRFSLVLFNV